MPLNSTSHQPTTRPNLAAPSLEGLAWLLRHPEEWPNHKWDFAQIYVTRSCGTAGCAIGIHRLFWGSSNDPDDNGVNFEDTAKLNAIFHGGCDDGEAPSITPSIVANRIDDYLAGRPIRYRVAGDSE